MYRKQCEIKWGCKRYTKSVIFTQQDVFVKY